MKRRRIRQQHGSVHPALREVEGGGEARSGSNHGAKGEGSKTDFLMWIEKFCSFLGREEKKERGGRG